MNKMLRFLLPLATLGFAVAGAQAQPTPKVAVVDMAEVLNKHYKTEEMTAKLNAEVQKVQAQLEEKNKQLEALGGEVQQKIEESKNSLLKDEVRKAAEADAQKKYSELQQAQQEFQNYRLKNQQSIQQRVNTHRDLLWDEISAVARDIARAKGATLVLDKSAISLTGAKVLVYSDPAFDITDDVLKEVNKNRPTPAAAPAATPAATPAPAASTPAPSFTVPNVTPAKKP